MFVTGGWLPGLPYGEFLVGDGANVTVVSNLEQGRLENLSAALPSTGSEHRSSPKGTCATPLSARGHPMYPSFYRMRIPRSVATVK